MPNYDSSQPGSQVLIHTPVSFNTDSGGRTMAVFQRTAGLGVRWPFQWLLTLNHRMEYRKIFEEWAHRAGLKDGAVMKNLFEYLADEQIYLAPDVCQKFEVSKVANPTNDAMLWQCIQEECKEEYKLRTDGSLAWKKTWVDGEYVSLDRFDRLSHLRVREMRNGQEVLHTEYFASSERLFARVFPSPGAKGAMILIEGGRFSTDGDKVPLEDIQKRWAAALIEEAGAPVVMLDDRAADKLFIDNSLIKSKVPTVAVIHSTHLKAPYENIAAISPYNGRVIAQSNRYTAIAFLTNQQLMDARCVSPLRNGHVIPHAAQKSRVKLGKTKVSQRFVIVTRLVKLKQVDHAIRAFVQVLHKYPAAELEIWGSGDQESDLKALVKELDIGKNVKFMGWTRNVSKVMQEATASIAVSQTEGFSLSILEALSHGLPVISYRFRYGPRDMIRDGFNGYLVPRGDVEELASAMIKILAHPIRTRMMGAMASTSRLRYSRRRVRKLWESLILSVSQ